VFVDAFEELSVMPHLITWQKSHYGSIRALVSIRLNYRVMQNGEVVQTAGGGLLRHGCLLG
jgi:hypothetical protein